MYPVPSRHRYQIRKVLGHVSRRLAWSECEGLAEIKTLERIVIYEDEVRATVNLQCIILTDDTLAAS